MTEMSVTPAIPAATILLLRDAPAFEVLMIKRHAAINFAGGAMVFPGGRIDEADSAPDWAHHCDGLGDIDPVEHAPRIGAIREAFEETGILYARPVNGGALIGRDEAISHGHLRGAVEADAARFLRLVRDKNLRLACDALQLFARWMPPEGFQNRRFDTWFFAAKSPAGQEACEDGNEATEAIWTAPRDVLAARDRGERKMIFPTVCNVELLNVSDSVAGVLDYAMSRKIDRVQPKIIDRGGVKFLTIPDDLGYPVTEEMLGTAFRT